MSTALQETGQTGAPRAVSVLEQALARQRAAYEAERHPTLAVRRDRLRRLEALIDGTAEALAEAIDQDFGGRSGDVTQLADLLPVRLSLAHTRRHLERWMAPRRVPTSFIAWPGSSRVVRQPLGVVGIVSPWNYPLTLSLSPAAAALAAGNRVLLKPSELTPRFSALLEQAVASRFDPGELAVITGDASVGRAFVASPLDHLLFTGSTPVGRQVAVAAAARLTPVTLELGGKSPVLVNDDADLERAALSVAAGKLLNTGQTCIAPDYALVPRERVEAFVEALRRAVTRLYPTVAGNADYTQVVSEAHHARLQALLDDAQAQGARAVPLHAQGQTPPGSRRMPPVALTDVHEGMRVMREEIFGPLLPVVGVDGLDQAIAHVNRGERPLALYWFGHCAADRERVLRETHSGGVTVNDTLLHFAQQDLPFGGVGASGMGAYHGEWGFRTFSHEKAVFEQSRWNGTPLAYPPYGPRFRRLMHWLSRLR